MYPQQNPAWLFLVVGPLGFVIYVGVMLGVLWLATRVVRHAWYWQRAPRPESASDEAGAPAGERP
jgi:multisubunit Na+/H+ antiporter MnhB subunit